MSSLTDILTATKNIVTAINGAAQTYLNVNGIATMSNITGTSGVLVKGSAGRIASISVIAATSGNAGAVYDAAVATSTTGRIGTIPTVPGVYVWNLPVTNGIVVVPGSGMTIAVSYS